MGIEKINARRYRAEPALKSVGTCPPLLSAGAPFAHQGALTCYPTDAFTRTLPCWSLSTRTSQACSHGRFTVSCCSLFILGENLKFSAGSFSHPLPPRVTGPVHDVEDVVERRARPGRNGRKVPEQHTFRAHRRQREHAVVPVRIEQESVRQEIRRARFEPALGGSCFCVVWRGIRGLVGWGGSQQYLG